MKKLVLFSIVCLLLCGISAYGNGKYDDVKPVIEKMAKVFEKFIVGMEKADSADAVVAALDAHTKDMTAIAPVVKELMKKYPELKDENNHPEELKPQIQKMEELSKRLVGSMGKLMQYAKDPKVIEAQKRWQKAMALMDDKQESEAEKEE
jgi:Fe-S oxidoreductase